MMKIEEFQGDYRFLSNFWPAVVHDFEFKGSVIYPTVEHAYQASKSLDKKIRRRIAKLATPSFAKKMGQNIIELRPRWNNLRVHVMRNYLEQKFANKEYGELLLATGNAELIEGNWWGDTFWGICRGQGENILGILLMEIRYNLKGETK